MKRIQEISEQFYLQVFTPPFSPLDKQQILICYQHLCEPDQNYLGEKSWSLERMIDQNKFFQYCLLYKKDHTPMGGAGLRESSNSFLISRFFSNSRERGIKYCAAHLFSNFIEVQSATNKRFLIFSTNKESQIPETLDKRILKNEKNPDFLKWKNNLKQFVKIPDVVLINKTWQTAFVRDLNGSPLEWIQVNEW